MNRKQIAREIDFVDNVMQSHFNDYGEKTHRALQEAIELIEQEVVAENATSDCISRETVLKLFATHDGKYLYEAIRELPIIKAEPKTQFVEKSNFDIRQYNADLQNAYDCGKASQEPKTEWIPVSKELPKEGEEVLVWYEYFRYGDYNCMYQTYGIGWQYDGHFSVDNGGVKQRVIAWCELPKPYSEVDNGNDD